MNIIILAQVLATIMFLTTFLCFLYFAVRNLRLSRLFENAYIKTIQQKSFRKLYPFVPKAESIKYSRTKKFLTSIGWKISVEGIYICKWCMFSTMFFMLVTMQTTNSIISINEIVQNVNYHRNVVETFSSLSQKNVDTEKQLYRLVSEKLQDNKEIYKQQNKQMYLEYIQNIVSIEGVDNEEDAQITAQRLYYKVLQTRIIRSSISPYIYIFLLSILMYYLPDILGQLKRSLIEDKKNWEILNCLIVFSIFGRMPPYSVLNILEHMVIVTEVYRPLLDNLIGGVKKGGNQDEAFDAALQAVDRDELYELIETLKLAKRTGLNSSIRDVDETITNTIKWIEIENISRRRSKLLYAMAAVAIVMALGCIYFAYGLTIISNPSNMIMK